MTNLTSIRLGNNNFTGNLNGIQNLASLSTFRADYNSLTGTINYLSNLVSLTGFVVDSNQLSGSVDTFQSLVNLNRLEISSNNIGSDIRALRNLTALTRLSVGYNSEMFGDVDSLSQLTKLTDLSLPSTQITGDVDSFTTLVNLETLNIAQLGLSGNISSFYGMTALTKLQLQNNAVTGRLDGIETLTDLQVLSADFNSVSGTLHPLASLQKLTHIQLTDNKLTGDLSAITGLVTITEMSLSKNQLTSTIPNLSKLESLVFLSIHDNMIAGNLSAFCQLPPPLKYLRIEGNYFEGNLVTHLLTHSFTRSLTHLFTQDCFANRNFENLTVFYADSNLLVGNLTFLDSLKGQLKYLSLSDNSFTGPIPSSIGRHTNLRFIDVSQNSLSGPMPSLQSLHSLTSLFIQSNLFTGDALFGINKENHVSLRFVDISNNRFSEEFPKEYFSLMSIETLAAAINCMTAALDSSVCNATKLESLILDGLHLSTYCSGAPINIIDTIYAIRLDVVTNIPSCIYSLPSLVTLHLSGNGIQHYNLPADVRPSNSLKNLLLSHNGITGSVPLYFQSHQWDTFDISYNKINGILTTINSSGNSSQEVTMVVNRLSGDIPLSARGVSNLNILDGNTFGCTTSDLEHLQADPSSEKYSCGSNSFDYSVGTAGVVTAVALFLLAIPYIVDYMELHSYQFLVYIRTQCDAIKTEINYAYVMRDDIAALYRARREVEVDSNRIVPLYTSGRLFASIRYYSFITACFYTVAYMPLYGLLSLYFRTRSEEYTWTLSVAFLSGTTPATILAVIYMLLVTLLAILSRKTILYSIKEFAALATIHTARPRLSRNIFSNSFKRLRSVNQEGMGNTATDAANMELSVIEPQKRSSQSMILKEHRDSQFKSSALDSTDHEEFGDVFLEEPVQESAIITKTRDMSVNSAIALRSKIATDSRSINRSITSSIKSAVEEINQTGIILLDELSQNEAYKSDRRYLVLVALATLNSVVVIASNVFFIYATLNFTYYGTIACQFFLAIFKIIWMNTFLLRVSSWLEKRYVYNNSAKDLRTPSNHHIRFYMGIVIFNSLILPCLVAAVVSSNCLFNAFKSSGTVSTSYSYLYCVVFDIDSGECETYITSTSDVSYVPPFYYTYECSFKTLTMYGSVYIYSLFLPSLIPMIHALTLHLYKKLRQKYPQYTSQAAAAIKSSGLCSPIMMICSGDETLRGLALENKLFKQKLFLLTLMSKVCVLFTFGFVCPLIGHSLTHSLTRSLTHSLTHSGIFAALSICVQLYYTQYQLSIITKYYLANKDLSSIETLGIQLEGLESAIIKCMWQLIPFAIIFYSVFLFDMSGDEIGAYSARGIVIFFLVVAIVVYFSPRLFYLAENAYKKYQDRHRGREVEQSVDDLYESYKTRSSIPDSSNPMHDADIESTIGTLETKVGDNCGAPEESAVE